jgi:hypothetical protein
MKNRNANDIMMLLTENHNQIENTAKDPNKNNRKKNGDHCSQKHMHHKQIEKKRRPFYIRNTVR